MPMARTPPNCFATTPLSSAAFPQGDAQALRHHKALGVPIAVERNGQVQWIEPDDNVVPEET